MLQDAFKTIFTLLVKSEAVENVYFLKTRISIKFVNEPKRAWFSYHETSAVEILEEIEAYEKQIKK